MSIALMTLAWKCDAPSGRKMVLLALCDNANDQGECYPSIAKLAEKCSMSERAIQGHLNEMVRLGMITRRFNAGSSTDYRLHPRRFCTPAESAPPQNLHPTPAESAPPPPQNLHPTPAESTPITLIEPSIESSVNQNTRRAKPDPKFVPLAALIELDVPRQVAEDWLTIRRAKKAPLTATALAELQAEAVQAGITVADAVRLCATRSWQGFKAAWIAADAGPAGAGRGERFNPGAFVNRNRRGGPR